MMKEMSSLDRKLENSMTNNHRDLSIRLSSNRQNADEILNIYDQLENETGDGQVDSTLISQASHKSKKDQQKQMTKQQQIQQLQQQQ